MLPELHSLSELTGYPLPAKIEDFDMGDFKKHFQSKFISLDDIEDNEDVIRKVTGKRMGIIETRLSQAFGLKPSDIKDLKLEQIIEKVAGDNTKTIETLKNDAASALAKKEEEFTGKLAEKETALSQYKTLAEQTQSEFAQFKTTAETDFKNYKITGKLAQALSEISFIDGFNGDSARKANFNTLLKSKYQFDLDAQDELLIKDEHGHRIKNAADATKLASPVEVLTTEAKANKLLKKNNGKAIYNTRAKSNTGGSPKFAINPRARARLENKV